MYKKIIITFLVFFSPLAWLEQQKTDKSSQKNTEIFDILKNNNPHIVDNFFDANEENND